MIELYYDHQMNMDVYHTDDRLAEHSENVNQFTTNLLKFSLPPSKFRWFFIKNNVCFKIRSVIASQELSELIIVYGNFKAFIEQNSGFSRRYSFRRAIVEFSAFETDDLLCDYPSTENLKNSSKFKPDY